MLGLNRLIDQGKVLYLGASDLPAWYVAKCNQFARDHGLHGFVVYQGFWNAAKRDFERDILSLCAEDGMAIAPWGAVGMGQFKSKEAREQSNEEGRKPVVPLPNADVVADVLEKIAKRKETLITSVALAYVMHKAPYVFPICGGRKVEHLKGNIEALGLELTEEDMNEIEGAVDFDIGWPFGILGKDAESNPGLQSSGTFDYVAGPKPIPAKAMVLR